MCAWMILFMSMGMVLNVCMHEILFENSRGCKGGRDIGTAKEVPSGTNHRLYQQWLLPTHTEANTN